MDWNSMFVLVSVRMLMDISGSRLGSYIHLTQWNIGRARQSPTILKLWGVFVRPPRKVGDLNVSLAKRRLHLHPITIQQTPLQILLSDS